MAMPKAEQRARNLEAQKRCRARKAGKKEKRRAARRASNARRELAKLLKMAEKFAAAAVAKDAEASGAQVDECPICLEELDDARRPQSNSETGERSSEVYPGRSRPRLPRTHAPYACGRKAALNEHLNRGARRGDVI